MKKDRPYAKYVEGTPVTATHLVTHRYGGLVTHKETLDTEYPHMVFVPEETPPEPVGKKYDSGKPRYSLLPATSLKEVVCVLTFGSVKYGDDNWMIVPNAKQRYTDALYRHIEDWRAGEIYDPESKLHHLAHAACCILFLIWFDLKDMGPK
jgi:hypothetical protein